MITDTSPDTRLARQIAFILELDKLKSILRRTRLIDDPRHENSAEHSWHISVMAIVLAEHSNAPIDTLRVVKMLLVHDIVEIDAGDTFVYDETGYDTKAAREQDAAVRIFGLLPPDQQGEMHALWREFEACQTPEAKFAAALDRLMPVLHNVHTNGYTWRTHGVTPAQVTTRNAPIGDGAEALWRYAHTLIEDTMAANSPAPPAHPKGPVMG